MPVMAKPMFMVTNPSFDENNLPNLTECYESILSLIIGNMEAVDASGNVVYNSKTGNMINQEKMTKFKTMTLTEITANLMQGGLDPYTATAIGFSIYSLIYVPSSNIFASGN